MKIATASLNQTPFDWGNNKLNIVEAIKAAQREHADLLCLPELCITGYGCEDLFLHEWVSEKAIELLLEIAPLTQGITTTLGLPLHFNDKIYNTIAFISNGEILGFQAKQNLPKDGIHYEPRWFSEWPSETIDSIKINGSDYPFGDRIYTIKDIKIGFEICEDAWVKDRPACRLVKNEVDLILNPSASHFALRKSLFRENKVIDASKEFNCAYVFANQLGNEAGRVIYDGDALIAYKGQILASTALYSFQNIEIAYATIDFDTDTVEQGTVKAAHGSEEEQFTAAVSLGLFDYLRKSYSKGFVLSLSGGADSSTCLVLLHQMVSRSVAALGLAEFLSKVHFAGKEIRNSDELFNALVIVAYQGTSNSSSGTLDSAKKLAESVHANFLQWSIEDNYTSSVEIIEQALDRKLTWDNDDITLQNIQARSRSPLIWMLANISYSLLITTSNRSEGSVGYATMDGDTSGSLAPIAGVSKPFILNWLQWAEKELGYSALSYVNKLTPTAELRPSEYDQSDEDDLMPYTVLNKIEELFIKQKLPPEQIFNQLKESLSEGMAAQYTTRFFDLWGKNQWKRERLAPSFHIADYNVDPRSWMRFPILSGAFKLELEVIRRKIKK
jgi:NAD+ synthase (glutamine-hydrolysing)